MKTQKILFFLLIIIWISISSYLTYLHYSEVSAFCSIIETINSCDSILKSDYSEIFWIPTSILWIFFYITTLILFLFSIFKTEKIFKNLLIIFTWIWIIFSAFFTYVQFFVINTLCMYCLTSAFITVLLFGFSFYFRNNFNFITKKHA